MICFRAQMTFILSYLELKPPASYGISSSSFRHSSACCTPCASSTLWFRCQAMSSTAVPSIIHEKRWKLHTHHIWVRGEIFIDFSLIQNSEIEWWTTVNHDEPVNFISPLTWWKNSCTASQERRLFGPLGPALGPESSSWVLSPEIPSGKLT